MYVDSPVGDWLFGGFLNNEIFDPLGFFVQYVLLRDKVLPPEHDSEDEREEGSGNIVLCFLGMVDSSYTWFLRTTISRSD